MKRDGLAFMFLCFIILPGFSQEGKWSLGVGFSPDYCSRALKGSGDIARMIIARRNADEGGKAGYQAGLYIKYRKNNIFEFESGLLYTNKGYSSTFDGRFGDQVDPMAGFTGDVFTTFTFHHYKYLGIPFKINARIVAHDKLALHVTGGAKISAFLEEKSVTYGGPDEKSITYNKGGDVSPVDVSPFIGMGIDIRLMERICLVLEPVYTYGLIPVYPADAVKMRLWSLGLNTVLYCRI